MAKIDLNPRHDLELLSEGTPNAEEEVERRENLARQAARYDPHHAYSFEPPADLAPLKALDSRRPETLLRLEQELERALERVEEARSEESEKAVYWLALQIRNVASLRDEAERAFPAMRKAHDALADPGHQHVLRCNMAGTARALGDLEAAEAWLALCDPAPPLLDLDSEYRNAKATLAAAKGRWEEVLATVGERDGEIPYEPASVGRFFLLRIGALEKLGRSAEAVAELKLLLGGKGVSARLLRRMLPASIVGESVRRVWARISPNAAVGISPPSRGGHLLFATIGAIGGVVLLALGVDGLLEVKADAKWVATEATIESLSSEEYEYDYQTTSGGTRRATGLRVKVTYAYEVDGRRYEGDRYSRFEAHDEYPSVEEGLARVEALREAESITVYYDPEHPAQAVVLEAELAPAIVVTVLGVAGLIAAAVALLRYRRVHRRYREAIRRVSTSA